MRALVTGGNGHVGFNLVSTLLGRGHEVSCTVRSLSDEAKTQRLKSLGTVTLLEADVRDAGQMRAALDGIDVLFHVAAVYSTAEKGRDAEIIDSAVRGTETTLAAAASAGVRRIVMTSSVVTVPLTEPGAAPSSTDDWATDARVPYFRAKIESERRAWTMARELDLELATILPAGIIGPGFSRPTPTIDLITACLMGEFRLGAPSGNFGFVDVRDVAEAHVLAFEREATGRFIVAYDVAPTYDDLVRTLGRIDRRVKPPIMVLPTFVAPMLPLYDALSNRVFGTPRVATPDLIATAISGRVFNFTCERAKSELGWSASVAFEQSLRDTLLEMGWRIGEA